MLKDCRKDKESRWRLFLYAFGRDCHGHASKSRETLDWFSKSRDHWTGFVLNYIQNKFMFFYEFFDFYDSNIHEDFRIICH
jgi:hypothetical protein